MTLYDQILNLPLFQGLSHDDLSNIVAHTKFDFTKVPAGSVIVKEGEPCKFLRFMLSGTAVVNSHADDNSFSVDEELSSPIMFEVERLFGLTQYHGHTITALTNCSLLVIKKDEVMRLSDKLLIIRINLLNRLATDVQKLSGLQWHQLPTSLTGRLLRFFALHTSYPAGHKVFHIKMQTLADNIRESRLNVSRQLNKWRDDGLITLSRGFIDIPRLEALLQLKDNP